MVVLNPRTSTANGTSFRGGHRGIYYSLRYEMPCNLRFFSAEPRKFLTSGAKSTFFFYYVPKIKPSAMSHAIHKTVSIKRCQSYFISRRSPHLGISKDSELCASAHRCLHYAYARLIARVTFHSSNKKGILAYAFQTVDKTLLVSTPEAFFLFSVQKVCT